MKTYFVDSFTTERFKGNPAAVCIVESKIEPLIMQSIATEIGFSETAFIEKIDANIFKIRFFTPKMEIPLCGHATLAASKIIFDITNLQNIIFINCENVELQIGKENGKIVMQFPVYETNKVEVKEKILRALGIDKILNSRYNTELKIIMIEIDKTETLVNLKPNFLDLINSHGHINGVLVTAQSKNSEYDFHYRYFWPWAGTNEDPATGGVQTFLTKYWTTKLMKNKLSSFQSSLRTGNMNTELMDNKVLIYGDAVIVFEGEFKNNQI